MKRFHVHIAVSDLAQNIGFYSKLFGQAPSVVRDDYAKWMLEDPRINFAISSRSAEVGVNHFGFQVDSASELDELKLRANAAAEGNVLDQGETTCCYSNSEKHWTTDPQGLAWEHFHTLSDAISFSKNTADDNSASTACCVPIKAVPAKIPLAVKSEAQACCVPNSETASAGKCC